MNAKQAQEITRNTIPSDIACEIRGAANRNENQVKLSRLTYIDCGTFGCNWTDTTIAILKDAGYNVSVTHRQTEKRKFLCFNYEVEVERGGELLISW